MIGTATTAKKTNSKNTKINKIKISHSNINTTYQTITSNDAKFKYQKATATHVHTQQQQQKENTAAAAAVVVKEISTTPSH